MDTVDKLKGCSYIYSNGEYVVITGTKLHILNRDGNLIISRKDLRRTGRITFLSDNRLLLCSSKSVFHMINLSDGCDIWTAPYAKTYMNTSDLAITPDERYAYTYDNCHHGSIISRLDLNTLDLDIQQMDMDIGATKGIICDDEGIPCLLKSLTETIGGKTVHQNGVRIHDYDGICPCGTTCWKTKWSFLDRTSIAFLGSADRILTNDLCVFEPSTGELMPLLKPEAYSRLPNQTICDCWMDSTGRYLCLMYQTGNVIIDMQTHSIAAQYAAGHMRGCLIGNEYWICVDDRIQRKPFPAFEEIPPVKISMNMDWYFAKRPELW